jgi:hypothetical protein
MGFRLIEKGIIMNAYDMEGNLSLIWNALHFYREHGIPEGVSEYDDQWSELCSAMAYISEDLGIDSMEGQE